MAADVGRWCRECAACQRAKITTQPTAPVQPIHVPSHRFTHVHVDLVGPLPVSSDGHSHVMTIIDQSTRRVEVLPLSSTTATACADAFVAGWIARFGVPASITIDRGVQFTSAFWAVLCQRLGVQHVTTSAYHPQSNSIVERFHRQLKDSLRARLASVDWPSHLPWVLLGLPSAPKEDHNVSSAELLYGNSIALPGELSRAPSYSFPGKPAAAATCWPSHKDPVLCSSITWPCSTSYCGRLRLHSSRSTWTAPCCRCMTAHTGWRPSLQRCSSCSWGAAWSQSQWTDLNPVCPRRWSRQVVLAVPPRRGTWHSAGRRIHQLRQRNPGIYY